jgi:uncharacterized protein (TIGR03435 family)
MINQILDRHIPRVSDEEVDAAGERILYRLHHATPQTVTEELIDHRSSGIRWWPALAFATAAVLVLLVSGLFFRTPSPAVVRNNAAVQTLADGSQIVSGAGSEWKVETASDGLRIRLAHGTIVVIAAKQRKGHLYVETRDLEASVVGTKFMVSAEELQSTVKVFEGVVRVRHKEAEVTLHAGEQYVARLEQTPKTTLPAQKPSFEVISIRRNTSEPRGSSMGPRGDRFRGTGMTLKNLLLYAFRPGEENFRREQIIGATGWMETERFDVDAKIGVDSQSIPNTRIREMLQSALEERFQLKAHREVRELPVYNLVLVKGGPKLSADQTPPPIRQQFINFPAEGEALNELPRGAARFLESRFSTTVTGRSVSMETIVSLLQGSADRMVIDKTNFKGLFDFDLQFAKDAGAAAPPEAAVPFLFSAIQELNLKLEPGKERLPVVVVESAQRPTEN